MQLAVQRPACSSFQGAGPRTLTDSSASNVLDARNIVASSPPSLPFRSAPPGAAGFRFMSGGIVDEIIDSARTVALDAACPRLHGSIGHGTDGVSQNRSRATIHPPVVGVSAFMRTAYKCCFDPATGGMAESEGSGLDPFRTHSLRDFVSSQIGMSGRCDSR